jgi:hypothetical protein
VCLKVFEASLAFSIHSNLPVFFSNVRKGSPFLPSRDIKRLRVAMQPVSFCTSLTHCGGPISVIDKICLALTSIPR